MTKKASVLYFFFLEEYVKIFLSRSKYFYLQMINKILYTSDITSGVLKQQILKYNISEYMAIY